MRGQSQASANLTYSSRSTTAGLALARGLEFPQPILQLGVFLLEPFDPHLKVLHLLAGANTHLLDNLDEAEETQDDDKRGDLLFHAPRQDIDEKTGDDDQGIKNMKPRVKVSERP